MKDRTPIPIPVKVGITDGQSTEVSGENLQEGMEILVGVEDTRRASDSAAPLGSPSRMPRH
jgi:hypothetical protein